MLEFTHVYRLEVCKAHSSVASLETRFPDFIARDSVHNSEVGMKQLKLVGAGITVCLAAGAALFALTAQAQSKRSEERRVGKEC